MDIETLTIVADALAKATGHAGDTAPEEGSEAQVILSHVLLDITERLGDEEGPQFLRMYGRACDRQDATPIIIPVTLPCGWHEEDIQCEACVSG